MAMPASSKPPHYRWSGRVRVGRFLLMTLVVLATAAAMSWGLHLLYVAGYYLIMIAPLVAAVPVVAVLVGAVSWSHCRNPVLAGLLGLAAGLVVSPGHYHADLVSLTGWRHVHRIDFLPRYLAFRMGNDVLVDVAAPDRNKRAGRGPDTVQVIFNWSFFALETLLASGLMMAFGIQRAVRAYAERPKQWMYAATGFCAAGLGRPLADAFQDGLAAVKPSLAAMEPGAREFCELTLEFCPPGDENDELGPGFLTIKEVILPGGNAGGRKETRIARQWLVEEEDFEYLATQIPAFAPALGPTALPVAATPTSAVTPGASADIRQVEPPYGGTVLTPRHLAIGTCIALFPLALALGVVAVLTALGILLQDDLEAPQVVVLILIGLGILAVSLWYMIRFGDYLPSRYLYGLSVGAVNQRPRVLVEPDNPDAVYVQVIPRQNWGKVMVENAADVGFLWVDRQRCRILFEGDRERWTIPAQALVSCRVERFLVGDPAAGGTAFYVAVLRARLRDAVWEGPVTLRHIYWGKRLEQERREDAYWVRDEIRDLLDADAVEDDD